MPDGLGFASAADALHVYDQSLYRTYVLKTQLPFGVWVRLEEHWVHVGSGDVVTLRAYGAVGFDGSAVLSGRLSGLVRGTYVPAERLVSAGDAFGLLRVTRRSGMDGQQLCVLPRIGPAAAVLHAAEQMPRRGMRPPAQDGVPELAGTRPYAPGDPLRRIHWRSSARTGELRAKELELPRAEGRQLIVLDAAGGGASAGAARWADPALAAAVEAAAGLALRALAQGARVRVAASDGHAVEAHGRTAVRELLAALAAVPRGDCRPEALAELALREARGSAVTVVTARADQALGAAIRRLPRGAVHVVYVHGPWSRAGAAAAATAWQRELEALGCKVTSTAAEPAVSAAAAIAAARHGGGRPAAAPPAHATATASAPFASTAHGAAMPSDVTSMRSAGLGASATPVRVDRSQSDVPPLRDNDEAASGSPTGWANIWSDTSPAHGADPRAHHTPPARGGERHGL